MDNEELKTFREMMHLSQDAMADLLGYSRRNYQLMEDGTLKIRNSIGLACSAIALGIKQYNGPVCRINLKKKRK